ncbi:MAG TPA: sigma 54-interacting transcriptional regulator [Pyrinomonadaceae bacterium]
MRNAVIINGNDFIPCSQDCSSLTTLLQRAHRFDSVLETSIASALTDVEVTPDLILPRFQSEGWAEHELEFCARTWPNARIFALLCDRELKHKRNIPPELFEVDDFLFCPYDEAELLLRMKRLLKRRKEGDQASGNGHHADMLIGQSETFTQAVRQIGLLAQSKAPVVISGETGSGKELFARAIHYRSPRSAKPFIPVNCGALPDELFENELFGHVKGAYTNASSAENGLIAEAEGGTLFLDEVDTLSSAAQIKLLRFLQSGEYRPLGSARSSLADVRIIAATNTDLARRVEQKGFREDLHYRLNILSLTIPALRDRATDIVELANHFVVVYAREHGRLAPQISEAALTKLVNHSWPGNVRELEGVIQRAIVLRDADVLTPSDLDLPECDVANYSPSDLFRLGKSRAIVQFERNFIARLLAAHGGNISRAAKAAGKDRRSFQRLISKYALDRKAFEPQMS